MEVSPDGHLPVKSVLRVRGRNQRYQRVEIHGRYTALGNATLDIIISSPDAQDLLFSFKNQGVFKLDIPLPFFTNISAYWSFSLESNSVHDVDMVCQITKIRLIKN